MTTDTCSFCGKKRDQVAWLVAGQRDVFICDECVALAAQNFDPPVTVQSDQARRILDTLRKPPTR
jgi:ATP-dependent Clp protease ATP-binding subunit ClpX